MQIRINHKTKTKASKRKDGTNLIAFGGGGGVAVGGGVRVSTATPWAVRAELPKAPDLSVDRSILRSGSSSSRRHDLIFVVNPSSLSLSLSLCFYEFCGLLKWEIGAGANGRTGKEWKKLLPYLRSRLGADCNAIREGADAVIAVGGDGTLHEVVNGFFWGGKTVTNYDRDATHSTALGLIPLGTGSDFARIFGWKNDPHEAIDRIAKGQRSQIDVGVISGEDGEPHYFANIADIHLRFGNLCYVIGSLKAFVGHRNQDLKIKVNEGEWEVCLGQ